MPKLRRTILILTLVTGVQTGLSQSLMFGLGGSYGSDIEQFAPNARLYLGLNEHICFGPEHSYFPTIEHDTYAVQLSEYGFVLHYIFEIKEKVGLYPLIGLNYSVEKASHKEESHTSKAFGASMGLGFHLTFNKWLPFAEYKYISGDLSQSTVSLGLIYNLHLTSEKQTERHHEHH